MAKEKKVETKLNQVVIEAFNYGDLKGESIYFTNDLYDEIKEKKDKSNVPISAVVWSSTNDDIHSEIQNHFILDTAGWWFSLVEDQTKAFKKMKYFLNLKS
jgi:hypothetical protein